MNIDSVSRSDALIVVYSVTDRASLDVAKDILKYLRRTFGYCRNGTGKKRSSLAFQAAAGQQPQPQDILVLQARPILLAGNKSDLVRRRTVSREGRPLSVEQTQPNESVNEKNMWMCFIPTELTEKPQFIMFLSFFSLLTFPQKVERWRNDSIVDSSKRPLVSVITWMNYSWRR